MNEFVAVCRLHGPGPAVGTVAIKDCIDIAGMGTCGGSRALVEAAPALRHADVVQQLLEAGWCITGKTNMHELAYGMTGINAWTGTPTNPQDASRIPGGSSSGAAAAVGADLVDVAIGSDTGGSIRLPAACCGVPGLKPTFGRVSRAGAHPRHSTLDCVGPLARSVPLIIAAMAAIAPGFDRASASVAQSAARVGLLATTSTPEVAAAVAAALAATGWRVEAASVPGMVDASAAGMVLINAETWAEFGHLTGRGLLGADIELRLGAAAATSAGQVAGAERTRTAFSSALDRALLHVDALVLPTLPQLPPTLAEVAAGFAVASISALVRPFNLSGHPAMTVPVPVAGSPLMTGLQLVGRKGEDERLCALALHLEHALRNV